LPLVASNTGPRYTLKLHDYAELEPMLAALRSAGCHIDDMEIEQTDLEDVFVSIMRENLAAAAQP